MKGQDPIADSMHDAYKVEQHKAGEAILTLQQAEQHYDVQACLDHLVVALNHTQLYVDATYLRCGLTKCVWCSEIQGRSEWNDRHRQGPHLGVIEQIRLKKGLVENLKKGIETCQYLSHLSFP